jgi:hypothetical protein
MRGPTLHLRENKFFATEIKLGGDEPMHHSIFLSTEIAKTLVFSLAPSNQTQFAPWPTN